MSTTTSKLALTKPDYRDARWDLPINANLEILDDVHGTVITVDKILETTANAVDAFIYDTSKDSDGGAWRKRIQDLSWYLVNGKIPAISLIVVENIIVKLYDLTDPAVPLWKTHDFTGYTITSVFMLNSKLCVTTTVGLYTFDYLSEEEFWYTTTSTPAIINNSCNDVAVTVLPDAPIDQITGLPTPTIAVATDGGVSIIDGPAGVDTVVDMTHTVSSSNEANFITFVRSGISWVSRYNIAGYVYTLVYEDLPIVDSSSAPNAIYSSLGSPDIWLQNPNKYIEALAVGNDTSAIGRNQDGIAFLKENPISPADGMVAYLTSSYFSGWMKGDIKLATLADSVAGDIIQDNQINNGDFVDGSYWLNYEGNTNWVISAGHATCDGVQASSVQLRSDPYTSLTRNITYKVSLDLANSAGNLQVYIGSPNKIITGDGHHEFILENLGVDSVTGLALLAQVGFSGEVDNVKVYEHQVEDRSVNNNPLQVVGTITKTPVATGSELMAYSGFSLTDYIEQPYNSDLDFGTGDFYVMGWFNTIDTIFTIAYRKGATTSFGLQVNFGSLILITSTGNILSDTPASSLADGTPKFVIAGRRDGNLFLHINGIPDASEIANSANLTVADATLEIGSNAGTESLDNGFLSLLRTGAGAPSDEQIKDIYEMEKKLFEEDAEYLLPSDNVQALDFDSYDNTLVVGTDLGTVRFKDLRKIEDAISVDEQTSQDIISISGNNGTVGLVTTAESGVLVPTLNLRESEAEVRGRMNTLIEEAGLDELLRLTNCFNGVKIDIKDIRVDGSDVHIDFEANGGGDIPFKYGDTWYTLDCTNGDGPDGIATVILEQGTDEVPLFQFIHMFYSESSGKVEVATTQIIPDDGKFGPVCYALCFTAAKVDVSGMAYIHRITDIVSDAVRGALSYGREKLRLGTGGNNRIRGCDVELEITTNASVRDNIFVTSLPGTFYQLHRHDWAGYYSGDYGIRALSQLVGECTIPNYGMITDLGTVAEDAEGNALVDGDSIYMDIIGIGTSCSCQRLAFAVSPRVYSIAQDCIDAAKLRIALPYPSDIKHLCFTLARMVLTYSSANGGTWGNALSATSLVWKSDVISTTTPSYPYYPDGAAEYIGPTLTHSGAVAVRVHFRDFDTERNYDYVRLRNAGGTNVFSYHGSLGAFTSANMAGDTIRPYFQSDGSVTRKGAYIDRFEYQVEVSTGGGEILDMR